MSDQENRGRRKILPIYMLVMFISPYLMLFLLRDPFEQYDMIAYLLVALLIGLFVVLLIVPSNARELDRVLDTEASAVTLGMTMYTAWFYPAFEYAFQAPELNGFMVAGFIFFMYAFARQLLRLKYR